MSFNAIDIFIHEVNLYKKAPDKISQELVKYLLYNSIILLQYFYASILFDDFESISFNALQIVIPE